MCGGGGGGGRLCSRNLPCSPDLALCDFFFSVPSSQKKFAGRKYASRQKFGAAIFNFLRDRPEHDYEKDFKDWI